MKTKFCSKCNIEKNFNDFPKNKSRKDKHDAWCKECSRKKGKLYYIKHLSERKLYRDNHKKHSQQYRELNSHKNINYQKLYRIIYKKELLEKQKEYEKKRRKTNINYRLKCILRTRIYQVLIGVSKSQSTMELIGCNIEQLKLHLESKFQSGMTWENYGFYGWHVDHIRPCASFDLKNPEQQRQCFNYSNLQPLWAVDNLRKADN